MYATAADLENRMKRQYAAIYADETTGEVDTSLVAEDLEASSAEIDGFLANRYVVPVTDTAPLVLLKSWNLTLAEELAWSRTPGSTIPEKVTKRVENVRDLLDRVVDGDYQILATEKSTGIGNAAVVKADPPVMNREDLAGW